MAVPELLDRTELKNRLINWIDLRNQAHANRDLGDYIFSNHLFSAVNPAEVEFAYTYRLDIVRTLADENELEALAEYCALATKRYTYRRNQFINFTGSYDELLYSEYRRFLAEIREVLEKAGSREALNSLYARVLRQHHERLRLILSAYCADTAGEDLLTTVPNEEYSARFQLRLLDLNLSRLVEPLLDIGCGASGALVNFLRGQGYEARGLDRLAPAAPHFYRQDWFEFDYGRQAWGLIVAHQSLSTHFIYNHLHNPATAEQYARLYMRILAGLQPGGLFCYTPGLPFFEAALEKAGRYSVRKTTIATNNTLGIGEIFYSVQVGERGA